MSKERRAFYTRLAKLIADKRDYYTFRSNELSLNKIIICIVEGMLREHSFSTFTKLSEKLTFLTFFLENFANVLAK